ncbi:MAG TPA: pitrilysin family protein [Vicinamibacterales bacterium]|nr:pitrilysin family protein [Vicinamibacterales bacterium]
MTTIEQRGLAPARSVLDNGVRVIAKHAGATPAVTLHASFEAGTIFDPASEPGVSHFVSRTIDRGTTRHTAEEIADQLENRGVSLAIAINRHALSLVCTCLVEDLDPTLMTLADVVTQPAFPDPEVETRRGEIITMIRQDEDNPAAMAGEGLFSLLYGEAHPYGRRPRGGVGVVERIPRASLQTFHADRFRPRALSLVLVGDVEPARAIESASRAFSAWKAAPPAEAVFPPAPSSRERRMRVIPMMNKAQADIAYGFTTILRADPAYYAYWLMNNILGEYSIGGRLGDSIRERQGMAYYVYSALDANVVPGPLLIRAGVNPANVDRALASIDEEVARMAADGPTEQEVAESRQYLIGSMPRRLETNVGIANFLQMVEFFGLGMDFDVRVPDLLGRVTRDEVHAAARAVLDPSKAAVVVAGPYSGRT